MAGRCLLFGHQWRTLPGVGEHAGTDYRVCVMCGKSEPVEADTAHAAEDDRAVG